jgi:CBS domain-containing protein
MITVGDLLRMKGSEVWSLAPTASLKETLQFLAEKNVGALLILDGKEIAGIISERDIVRLIAREGTCRLDSPVGDIMTREVITIKPDQSLQEAMKSMSREHFRHLPVVADEGLRGLISIGDVVRALIDEQSHTITDLEGFITGSYGQ